MNKFEKIDCFAIGEMHPLFKGLGWVAAARSDDEERDALQHVLIEREGETWHMVALDGKRLHHAEYDAGLFSDDLDMLGAGLWEVIVKNNKVIVVAESECAVSSFPDWRKTLPKSRPFYTDQVKNQTISKISMRTRALLNTDFVADAVGFGTICKKNDSMGVEYFADGDDGPVCIKNDVGTAVLARMKIEDAEPYPSTSPLDALTGVMAAGDSLEISIGGTPVRKIVKTAKGAVDVAPDEQESEPEGDEA
ncbi:MAG: hypothetical protein V4733_03625 [Verrucomicrobiota bacterium]